MADPRETLVELLARAIADGDGWVWSMMDAPTQEEYCDHARRALNALSAAPPELWQPVLMPWRSMETAPRNGTRMLLFGQHFGVGYGWHDSKGFWVRECQGIWQCDPTGWLPLPPPGDAP